ncbi:MAG: type II toxin-antitoxin system HipA family toxin [Myxococcota bacterium]
MDPVDVEVWADWRGLSGPTRLGLLSGAVVRNRETFRFAYDDAWLKRRGPALALDPRLAHVAGPQYPRPERGLFGLFLDSCPDRWGRALLQRREAARAKRDDRRARRLRTWDYLLGVFDPHRMGGLRVRVEAGGAFLDDDAAFASPPWTRLRELVAISLRLEREGVEDAPEYVRWLSMLIAPGRSVGGARPKASVVDDEGRLWIAKFPSREDTEDVGAWEAVAHDLAKCAGIDVPVARCQRIGHEHHTFISRRFDRVGSERLHMASAMTLLERIDGETDGASYLHLAEVLIQRGGAPEADLEQLWRRIAFNVCISNVDDHLRNHAFLLTDGGWRLAPAYDMNPVPWGDGLSLDISDLDNAQDLDLVREVAPFFRVNAGRARQIVEEVVAAVRSWRTVAAARGIGRNAQERMAPAFRIAEA